MPVASDAPLRLPTGTVDAMIEHARAESPIEACGMIGIADDGTPHLHRMTNMLRSPTRYAMHPGELLQVLRVIEDDGQELVIWHSHPMTPAEPSQTDIAHAHYPEATWLIVGLADPATPDVRAWRIRDGLVTQRTFVLAD